METFLQCFPLMSMSTTCLPLSKNQRNKKKIFAYKNLFQIFKNRKTGDKKKSSDKKIDQEKQMFDASHEKREMWTVGTLEEIPEYPISTNILRNCPCKICEMRNVLSLVFVK